MHPGAPCGFAFVFPTWNLIPLELMTQFKYHLFVLPSLGASPFLIKDPRILGRKPEAGDGMSWQWEEAHAWY